MRLKLSEKWKKFLKDQPESAVGWHMADITFKDGTYLKNAKILNGEYLVSLIPYLNRSVEDIKVHRKKLAIRMRIKPPKRRTPSERLRSRLYYRRNRSKIRLQRRKYLRKHKTTLKNRKLFLRYKPVWFKKPSKSKHPIPKKFKVTVPKKMPTVSKPKKRSPFKAKA